MLLMPQHILLAVPSTRLARIGQDLHLQALSAHIQRYARPAGPQAEYVAFQRSDLPGHTLIGCAYSHPDAADWLGNAEQIPGWTN